MREARRPKKKEQRSGKSRTPNLNVGLADEDAVNAAFDYAALADYSDRVVVTRRPDNMVIIKNVFGFLRGLLGNSSRN